MNWGLLQLKVLAGLPESARKIRVQTVPLSELCYQNFENGRKNLPFKKGPY